MRIDQILASGAEPVFSFEFFPPKTPAGERNLYAALAELRTLEPSFVSVTYGAGGSTREKTIEIVKRIRDELGLEAMAHFTCVGATVPELRATLDQMLAVGIDNVLALRGDPPAGHDEWVKTEGGLEYSRELVALIARRLPVCDRRRLLSRDPHPRRQPRGRSGLPRGEGRRRRGLSDHPAVLRQRPVLRLPGPCSRRRDRRADHPRHHADHPLGPGGAHGRHVRRLDPRRSARGAARARRGGRGRARLRRRLRHAAMRRAAGRRRSGHSLLHAQSLARHARDPVRAQALPAVGRFGYRRPVRRLSSRDGSRGGSRRLTARPRARSPVPRPVAASRRTPRSARPPSRSAGTCPRPMRPAASANR